MAADYMTDMKKRFLNGDFKNYSSDQLLGVLHKVMREKERPKYEPGWAEKEAARELAEKEAYDQKNWDWISLDWQQLKDITELIREQFESHDYTMKHVALRKVALRYRGEICYFTAVSANLLHIRQWLDDEDAQCWGCDFDVKIMPREMKLLNRQKIDPDTLDFLEQECATGDGRSISNFEDLALLYLILNEFMLHYGEIAFNVHEIQCKGPSKKKEYRGSTVETRVVRLMKQYTLKKNWVTKVERRKAEIRCQAWGVRGHFRHYRNGTVIFIQPYVKGKNKEKYKGKVYELLPKTV